MAFEEIKGLTEALNVLRGMASTRYQDGAVRRSMRSAAYIAYERALQTVPHATGLLASEVKVRSGKRSKNKIRIVVGTPKGSPAYYGIMQNVGWYAGGKNIKGKRDGKIVRKNIGGTFVEGSHWLTIAGEATKGAQKQRFLDQLIEETYKFIKDNS